MPPSPLDDAELFETFVESQLRLTVVEWLSAQRGPVGIEELSRSVADEHGLSTDVVEMRLHHVHLPKLARLGLLAYDVPEQTVESYSPGRLGEVAEWFITAFPGAERRFVRNERPPESGESIIQADSNRDPSESMGDGGHVEVPPPRGSDEDD
jgi:hypothetical protein